jgi:hypothetical protein
VVRSLLSCVGAITAMDSEMFLDRENQGIVHSLAKNWQEVEPYKEPVYFPFFEKAGYKKEYLEERWIALKEFYKTDIASIILFKKFKNPIGFLTIEPKDENALLYASPMLIDHKDLTSTICSAIKDFYPTVTTGYCMAQKGNEKIKELLENLGWKQVEKSPIEPNEQFIKGIDYIVFSHSMKESSK